MYEYDFEDENDDIATEGYSPEDVRVNYELVEEAGEKNWLEDIFN